MTTASQPPPTDDTPDTDATVRLTFAMTFPQGRLTSVTTGCERCRITVEHRTTDLALGWTEVHAYAHKLAGPADVTR